MAKSNKKAKTVGQLLAEITIQLSMIVTLGGGQQGGGQPTAQGGAKPLPPTPPKKLPTPPPKPQPTAQPSLQGVAKIQPPIPPQQIVQEAVQLLASPVLQGVNKIGTGAPQGGQMQQGAQGGAQLVQGGAQGGQAQQQALNEDDDYMDKLNKKSMKYISKGGTDHSSKIKDFHDGTDTSTEGTAAKALMTTHGLTLAESTAIGIYTASDYLYMNPASAKNKGWMKSALVNPELEFQKPSTTQEVGDAHNNGGVTDQLADEAAAEGDVHNKMAMKGLAKLPDWNGDVFRGVAFDQQDFDDKYGTPTTTTFPAFSSCSLIKTKSLGFAKRNAVGGKMPILLEIHLTKGKDIRKLSAFPDEEEILVLPGATFNIVHLPDVNGVKMVKLDQTA